MVDHRGRGPGTASGRDPDPCTRLSQTVAGGPTGPTGPCLGLYLSVVLALTYLRRNRVQAELAETYGVSQPTVSRAISAITPLLGKVLKKLRSDSG